MGLNAPILVAVFAVVLISACDAKKIREYSVIFA